MSWRYFQSLSFYPKGNLFTGLSIFWPQAVVIYLSREELPKTVLMLVGLLWFITFAQWMWRPFRFNQKVFNILSLAIPLIIFFQFKTFLGRDSAASFLLLLAALKAFEFHPERDRHFSVYLNIASLAVGFLFEMGLLPSLLVLVGLATSLFNLLSPSLRVAPLKRRWSYIVGSMVLAVPLTVFLFFIFPRLGFSFSVGFGTGNNNRASTGFSDEIKPGSFSDLIQTDEIIFRAHLKNFVLDSDLYWRALPMESSDGMKWERINTVSAQVFRGRLERNDYDIELNPQSHRWLFVLDGTKEIGFDPPKTLTETNGQYQQSTPSNKILVYEGMVSNDLPLATPEARLVNSERDTSVWKGAFKGWVEKLPPAKKIKDKIRYLENFLRIQGFEYSLQSESLVVESLNDFLFNKKTGYCEHYASAMAHALRYWSVPARVVAGFVGGDKNVLGEYITVRGRHAHAWIEYIDESGRWVRWDPTRIISPEIGFSGQTDFSTKGLFKSLFLQIETFSDYANYEWTQFFLGYDRAEQVRKFDDFIFPPIFYMGITFLLTGFLTLLYYLWLRRKKPDASPSEIYRSFVKQLDKKYDWEKSAFTRTPKELENDLCRRFPGDQVLIMTAFNYFQESYRPEKVVDPAQLKDQFKTLMENFSKN
ncbi:MAG: DUF3488 and transglutaminase-like domain-containing protein [Bdellovibrionota bacterium]